MRKKGFTLVELLAIIVVLSVVILIATPQILGVIETSRQNAAIESTKGYVKSINNYIALNIVDDKNYNVKLEDGTYQVNKDIPYDSNNIQTNNLSILDRLIEKVNAEEVTEEIYLNDTVKVKGKKPEAGYVIIENNKVIYAEIIVNSYNVTYDITKDPVAFVNGKVGSDITPPSISLGNISKTTTSAVITYTVEDKETGIKQVSCKYGLANNNYTSDGVATETSCSILNLTSNTEYYYEIIAENNDGAKRKTIGSFKTGKNVPPSIVLDDETTDWKQSRKATITFDSENISTPKYYIKTSVATTSNENIKECEIVDDKKVCNGETSTSLKANTWYETGIVTEITFTSEGNLYTELNDGAIYITSPIQQVAYVDSTPPTVASLSKKSSTSNSITVTALGTDEETNIVRYQFSKDNGNTWEPSQPQASNEYTFTNLLTGTYNIKVKVFNETYLTEGANANNTKESSVMSDSTVTIPVPTIVESPSGYATSKTVTITYPSGYVNEYSLDEGTTWTAYTTSIPFTSDGSVIARVNDGTNYVASSSQTITGIITGATQLTYDNTKTGIPCNNVQCAIDYLSTMR